MSLRTFPTGYLPSVALCLLPVSDEEDVVDERYEDSNPSILSAAVLHAFVVLAVLLPTV